MFLGSIVNEMFVMVREVCWNKGFGEMVRGWGDG